MKKSFLSLFLSLFIMWPVLTEINTLAVQPYIDGALTFTQAVDVGQAPLREWMLHYTREEDLALMTRMAGQDNPESAISVFLYGVATDSVAGIGSDNVPAIHHIKTH